MKKIVALISMIFLVGMLSIGFTALPVAADDPVPGVPSGDSVSYDHPSVLNVIETITDLGGGTWKYSYEFTNTEPNAIWHFGVWTTFDAGTATQTTFVETAGTWSADGHDINAIQTEYDARNLDACIIWASHTWDNPYPMSPNPIPAGAYVSGFSFTANVLDTSPKYYWYEIHGSYAVPGGNVTAVGLTVPGDFFVIPEVPLGTAMTLLSMFIALIGFAGFKRFRPKFPL